MSDGNQAQGSSNFVDLFQRMKSVTSRLDLQVNNILFLEELASSNASIDPSLAAVTVTIEDRAFDLPAEVFGDQGLSQLIEPMTQAANNKVTDLVSEMYGVSGQLHKLIFPDGEDAQDGDEKIEIPNGQPGNQA